MADYVAATAGFAQDQVYVEVGDHGGCFTREAPHDVVDGVLCHGVDGLGNGTERAPRETGDRGIIEAHDQHVLRYTDTTGAELVHGPNGHVVVGRYHGIDVTRATQNFIHGLPSGG